MGGHVMTVVRQQTRRSIARFPLLAFALLCPLLWSPAKAAVITLVCQDPLRDYSILFDDRTGVLIWKSAMAEVQYQLRRVHYDKRKFIVWGRTRDYGNDYLMEISDKSWIKYFYGNGSNETDPCTIISRKN